MDDNGNRNHMLLILAPILAIFVILVIAGLTKNVVNTDGKSTSGSTVVIENESGDSTDMTVINSDDKYVFIEFEHAGDTPEGEYISDTVTIKESIKQGDIPNYSDKDQNIIVSGNDKSLSANAVKALKSMGYKNVTTM